MSTDSINPKQPSSPPNPPSAPASNRTLVIQTLVLSLLAATLAGAGSFIAFYSGIGVLTTFIPGVVLMSSALLIFSYLAASRCCGSSSVQLKQSSGQLTASQISIPSEPTKGTTTSSVDNKDNSSQLIPATTDPLLNNDTQANQPNSAPVDSPPQPKTAPQLAADLIAGVSSDKPWHQIVSEMSPQDKQAFFAALPLNGNDLSDTEQSLIEACMLNLEAKPLKDIFSVAVGLGKPYAPLLAKLLWKSVDAAATNKDTKLIPAANFTEAYATLGNKNQNEFNSICYRQEGLKSKFLSVRTGKIYLEFISTVLLIDIQSSRTLIPTALTQEQILCMHEKKTDIESFGKACRDNKILQFQQVQWLIGWMDDDKAHVELFLDLLEALPEVRKTLIAKIKAETYNRLVIALNKRLLKAFEASPLITTDSIRPSLKECVKAFFDEKDHVFSAFEPRTTTEDWTLFIKTGKSK